MSLPRRPRNPRINWGHPLAQELLFCYLPNNGGLQHDLVTGTPGPVSGGTPPSFVASLAGEAARFTAQANQEMTFTNNGWFTPVGGVASLTVAALTNPVSEATWAMPIGIRQNSGDYSQASLIVNGTGAASQAGTVTFLWRPVATSTTALKASMTDGNWHLIAGSLTYAGYPQLYIDGKWQADGATGSTAQLQQANLFVGGGGSGTASLVLNADLGFAAIWGRSLTPRQHAELAVNPYAFLEEAKVRKYWFLQPPSYYSTNFNFGSPPKKPANPRINWGHPLAQGLMFCVVSRPGNYVTGANSDTSIVEMVQNAQGVTASLTDYSPQPVVTERGEGFAFTVANVENAQWISDAYNIAASAPASLWWTARWDFTAGTQYGLTIGTGATTSRFALYKSTSGTNRVGLVRSSDSGIIYDSSPVGWHTYAGTSDGLGNNKLYTDARQVSSTAAGGTDAITGGASLGKYINGASPFDGQMTVAYAWRRLLTPSDILWLEAEPFAFLEEAGPKDTIYLHLPPSYYETRVVAAPTQSEPAPQIIHRSERPVRWEEPTGTTSIIGNHVYRSQTVGSAWDAHAWSREPVPDGGYVEWIAPGGPNYARYTACGIWSAGDSATITNPDTITFCWYYSYSGGTNAVAWGNDVTELWTSTGGERYRVTVRGDEIVWSINGIELYRMAPYWFSGLPYHPVRPFYPLWVGYLADGTYRSECRAWVGQETRRDYVFLEPPSRYATRIIGLPRRMPPGEP